VIAAFNRAVRSARVRHCHVAALHHLIGAPHARVVFVPERAIEAPLCDRAPLPAAIGDAIVPEVMELLNVIEPLTQPVDVPRPVVPGTVGVYADEASR
jgi:hypothetical protein